MSEIESRFIELDGLRLHYREAGEGDPVLLLHGWPTSSLLWRHIMPHLASEGLRAIALDLPGFGQSSKPLEASYSLRFFDRVLEDFLAALDLEEIGLGVHDLGGPIGLYWAVQHPRKLRRLALLNTLVYPEMSWAVVAFVTAARLPGLRHALTSPWGLKKAMQVGVADRSRLQSDVVPSVQAPFRDATSRRALAKAGCNISPKGVRELSEGLRDFTCPVRIVYGERDRILPDVAETMARVKKDLPQAELTALPDCGHFLQEERPDEIGRILADFFSGAAP